MKQIQILLLFVLIHCVLGISKQSVMFGEQIQTGFINVTDASDIFYWLVQSRNDPKNDPLVIWLNGGPGSSSSIGNFGENGPFILQNENSTEPIFNPFSWNNISNVLYVDQPVGTGFSFAGRDSDFPKSELEVAEQFERFLKKFIEETPQFLGKDLYITGESYAGHYIPAIAEYLMKNKIMYLNLKGVAIGNGWIDPIIQYSSFALFAFKNNLINETEFIRSQIKTQQCIKGIKNFSNNRTEAYEFCESIVSDMQKTDNPHVIRFNQYDIRLKKPTNNTNIQNFYTSNYTRENTIIGDRQFGTQKDIIYRKLDADELVSVVPSVQYLLSTKIQMFVYNGDQDFICNWLGSYQLLSNMEWTGKNEFINQNFTQYYNYGEVKSVENLKFFRIFNSSHFVPVDQPEGSFQLLQDLIKEGRKYTSSIISQQ